MCEMVNVGVELSSFIMCDENKYNFYMEREIVPS